MTEPLLTIDALSIGFGPEDEPLRAVRHVGLDIAPGEIVGLVGESGSGKSLTCRSVMRLVPAGGHVLEGSVRFDGRDVLALGGRDLRALRAKEIGMIFQDPFSSLNPVYRVGDQLMETLRVNRGMGKAQAREEAVALLDRVGIPDPARRLLAYPHELSGGMRQRVMIALATASEPRLLIADEPTTALDVTTQAQILELLLEMRERLGMAILLVSHDFGVIAQVCDRVAVMYGGHVVETGPVETLYRSPQHPYTRALLESVPELEAAARDRGEAPRPGIPGRPPELGEELPGCVFAPRCAFARPECEAVSMALVPVGTAQASACPIQPFKTTEAVPA
jgi:oligopeptide/dipeptide ABC transporter ATP-binding protein